MTRVRPTSTRAGLLALTQHAGNLFAEALGKREDEALTTATFENARAEYGKAARRAEERVEQ